jgi:3-methylfumaryl-CoA hydratase
LSQPALGDWIGRSETLRDVATPFPFIALNATLDHADTDGAHGTPLHPLWHWLYFLPRHRQSEIGPDGHAKRGGFLPPVPLPRRMWAGSRLDFLSPVRLGDAMERRSTIENVVSKSGRSGELVFVTVRHEVHCNGAANPAIREWHDIVYRAARQPGEADPPQRTPGRQPQWRREIVPDDVLLFRYSALTFNGHRIHYDRKYVTEVEGYPGLIVHGPLIATLLMDLLRREMPQAVASNFQFKAVRPTFDLHPFHVNGAVEGKTVHLWGSDHEGALTMEATATLK